MGIKWSERSKVTMTWANANEYVKSLGKEWRLPELHELAGMVNAKEFKEGLTFWSSTGILSWPKNIWIMHFDKREDDVAYKNNKYHVVCVKNK